MQKYIISKFILLFEKKRENVIYYFQLKYITEQMWKERERERERERETYF